MGKGGASSSGTGRGKGVRVAVGWGRGKGVRVAVGRVGIKVGE